MAPPLTVHFSHGGSAPAAYPRTEDDLPEALGALGLGRPRPALVLVGGASRLGTTDAERLRPLLRHALLPVASAARACVVDGGTDSGIFALAGRAHAEHGATVPLLGVAPAGRVALPGVPRQADQAPLEPHHTAFLLVPGAAWGDEAPWLARAATALAAGQPSATLLANGGDIALRDVELSVQAQRLVVVLSGSGRLADRLALAVRGHPADVCARPLVHDGVGVPVAPSNGAESAAEEGGREPAALRVTRLVATGLLQVVDVAEGSGTLARTLERALSAPR